MARYKVLKSVAHSFGHSFTSLMNYARDDYVMGHIVRFARATGKDTIIIDLLTGQGSPAALLQDPIADVPQRYSEWLRDLVTNHKSDMKYVSAAALTLHIDLKRGRQVRYAPGLIENPYRCEVVITDDRGKEYSANFAGWWFPELTETPTLEKAWWRFW